MKLTLADLKRKLKLDIPMRKLRHEIAVLRFMKNRTDSKENQIKKLKKEIREGKVTEIARDAPSSVK